MTRLLFFGPIRDRAGCSQMDVQLPPEVDNLAALRAWLAARDPDLGEAIQASAIRVAINHAFVGPDALIVDGAEIAFMSPLSGG